MESNDRTYSFFKIAIFFFSLVGLLVVGVIVRNTNVLKIARAASAPSALTTTIDWILGQPSMKETMTNLVTNSRTFHAGGVHVDRQGRVYVFDSGNSRVLGFAQYTQDRPADIVIGQPNFDSMSANGDNTVAKNPTASTLALQPYPVVNSPLEGPREGQMASDQQGNLYVPDLVNNRVLKYNDPFNTDTVADEVWGQPDMTSRTPHCGQSGQSVSDSTFCFDKSYMAGVEIDTFGNLWVADTGNNRVLRFPNNGGVIAKNADVVLGQANFTSSTERPGFDTSLSTMLKPNSISFDANGDMYVLEGEWSGQARMLAFAAPFTNGMAASREIGRATVSDTAPADTTGWEQSQGKWVKPATGLYWPRGIMVDPNGSGIWVNDTSNDRMVLMSKTDGQISQVIGQPDVVQRGCLGHQDQGFMGVDGNRYNLCEPNGGIGLSSDGSMFVATDGQADPRSVVKFGLPLTRGTNNLAVANGRLLHEGWNMVSVKTLYDPYGMSVSTVSGQTQLIVSDHQRLMVWNNPAATFAPANFIVGQDAPDTNLNNNGGVFSAIDLGPQSIGGGQLWVSAYDRIYAFALPFTAGGKNYPTTKILYTGQYPQGNVTWADDGTKVPFRASGIAYNQNTNTLWISDSNNKRVLRVINPLGNAQVDMVLGQPDKNSASANGGLAGPNAKGFAEPWFLQFDKFGNLYVTDSKWEGGGNNRVVRFDSATVNGSTMFSFAAATGVYARQSLTSTQSWGSESPNTPSSIAFDDQNRMVLTVDSYGNNQNQKVFIYNSGHEKQAAPQPEYVLPIAFGQAAQGIFYPDANHLLLLDHTWNRVLQTSLVFPSPTLGPTATLVPTKVITPSPTVFVPSPTPVATQIPANSYAITYDKWRGVVDSRASGGGMRTSTASGSFMKFSATVASTDATVILYKGPDQGKANISIDGSSKGTVDLYAPTPTFGFKTLYTKLTNKKHVVKVEVVNQKNKSSSGTGVAVDRVDFGPVMVEDNAIGVSMGNWDVKASNLTQNGTISVSSDNTSKAEFGFNGTKIDWLTRRGTCCGGKTNVYLDSTLIANVNFYDINTTPTLTSYTVGPVSAGSHILKLNVTGNRAGGQSDEVFVEGFRVY